MFFYVVDAAAAVECCSSPGGIACLFLCLFFSCFAGFRGFPKIFFCLSVTQREGLDDPGIRLASFAELVERQLVVVVFIHLAEDLVHPSLWSVFIFRVGSLTLNVKDN